MRERVIELKRVRRVTVGRHLSFVFENRDTVLFQIQEMCRVERITDDAKIQDELDAIVPGPRELSATLFIEITDKEQIQPVLDRFMGIDIGPTVWIQSARSSRSPASSRRATPTRRRGSSRPSTSCASSFRRRPSEPLSTRPSPSSWTTRPSAGASSSRPRRRPSSSSTFAADKEEQPDGTSRPARPVGRCRPAVF